jgi:Outer membrane protein beta-barrel domain
MKKFLLSITAMLTFSLFTYAQSSFAIMPKAGVSMGVCRMGLDNYSNKKMNAGFVGGFALPIGFGDYFEVQPEFYYIQKNSQFDFKGDGTPTLTMTRHLEQFELPILLKAKYEGFYVSAGPSITFNSSGQDEVSGIKTDLKFGDAATELSKTQWGMQFGVGYNFEVGVGKLNFDARYGLGLSDLDNVTGDKNTTHVDALAFTVGYAIPIGK